MLTLGTASVLLLSLASVDAATDHPWIRRFASIGDSYAAGLGAADRMDWSCSRYGGSYPNLLHTKYFGDRSNRTHQFLACSGATTKEVLEKQLPELEDDIDVLTITAGGNDIGLTPVLNNCIYKFYMAGDCNSALQRARRKIADEANLQQYMKRLLKSVKPKINSNHGVVFVTGYAGFFGADDHTCDNVTWAVWRNVKGDRPLLKLEMRTKLNELVQSVNGILRTITESAGPNFRFIDYDQQIKNAKGRYCEAGVVEPDPNRKGLDFYEWDTVDNGESIDTLQMTGDDVPRGSFEAFIAESINMTLQEHPDWEFEAGKGFVNKSKVHPDGYVEDVIWWMLPDSWKRVFHLRPEAHGIIAQMIVDDIAVMRQEALDKTAFLLFFGAGALGAIILTLLLVAFLKRQKRVARAHTLQEPDAHYTDDDEATLAEPTESSPPNFKGYSTFN